MQSTSATNTTKASTRSISNSNVITSSHMDPSPVTVEYFSDTTYHLEWSPTHPTLYAAVDSAGVLKLTDVTGIKEMETISMAAVDDPTSGLCSCAWSNNGN